MKKDDLLAKYTASLGSARPKQYLAVARDFLQKAKTLNREGVEDYLEALRKKGELPGTIAWRFSIVRRLFKVNQMEWPFRRGEAPGVPESQEWRPALSPELIRQMIDAARQGHLSPEAACFLALSSTYGLRREEMVAIEAEDVDYGSGLIFIKTVKSGRQRYHQIPPEIVPYLERHAFEHYSLDWMSQMFWTVVWESGLGELRRVRLGWHSIRRSLLTGLQDRGLNTLAAKRFLRWRTGGEDAMPLRYYSNVTISLKGSQVISEEAKGDTEVFEKYHPFLGWWRKE